MIEPTLAGLDDGRILMVIEAAMMTPKQFRDTDGTLFQMTRPDVVCTQTMALH